MRLAKWCTPPKPVLLLLTCLPQLHAPLPATLVLHTEHVGANVHLQLGPVTLVTLCVGRRRQGCQPASVENPERSIALLLACLLSALQARLAATTACCREGRVTGTARPMLEDRVAPVM